MGAGNSLFNLKDFEEAIKTYSKIEESFPSSRLVPTSLYQIAGSYFKLGKYTEARMGYEKFLNLYPDDPMVAYAQYAISWTYFHQEKFAEGELASQKVILNYPGEKELIISAYSLMGNSQYNQEKYAEALRTFQSLAEKYPQSNLVPAALLRMGECYEQLGDDDESFSVFRRVARDYAGFKRADFAQWKIASYFIKKEDYAQAASEFRNLIANFPRSSYLFDAYYWQGWSFHKLDNFPQAVSAYSKFIQFSRRDDPLRGEVYYRWGESLFKQKKFKEAIECYSEALEILAETEKEFIHNSLYQTALCWENLQNWEEEGKALQEFITRFRTSSLITEAHLELANSLFMRDKFFQAREHYSWVIQNSEKDALAVEAQFGIGNCWFNQKDYDKALVEYLRVPLLYPQYREWRIKARLQIGRSYYAQGKYEEARKEYEKVLGEESLEEKWINEAKKRLKELGG